MTLQMGTKARFEHWKQVNMNSLHSVHHNQTLYFLLSQYELLERTAHHLSALDLFNLALTCQNLHSLILESHPVFSKLKRLTICSGQGLHKRQTFTGMYKPHHDEFIHRYMYGPRDDEEIEVRLYNLKCDTYNALPCQKCGVNICEECRYVPRVRDTPFYKSRRRPHHNPGWEREAITCYCHSCDEKIQNTLPTRLSELCDCDQYTRWICHSCRMKEDRCSTYKTAQHWEGGDGNHGIEEGLWLPDHQTMTAYWCPCGKRAPRDGNVRCSWCLRRHDLDTWLNEDPNYIPYFDGPLGQSEREE